MLPHAFTDRAGRSLCIREVEEADAAALLGFTAAVDGESTHMSREPSESPGSVPIERQRISQLRGRIGSLGLLALDGAEVVGSLEFAAGTRRRTAHAGEFGLSVRRAYWGAGVGGHLLDTLVDWARAGGLIRKIRLRVQAVNEGAIALYTSRGFVPEGLLRREHRVDGVWVDLVAMALWLDGPEGAPLEDPRRA